MNQSKIQLPALQQSTNPHEYFNQISDRLPAAQAAVDAIPDDKVRDAASKQLKLKYEQARLGDAAWKNGQAQVAQQYAQDPRYASSMIPQTVKNKPERGELSSLRQHLMIKTTRRKIAPTADRRF